MSRSTKFILSITLLALAGAINLSLTLLSLSGTLEHVLNSFQLILIVTVLGGLIKIHRQDSTIRKELREVHAGVEAANEEYEVALQEYLKTQNNDSET